MEHSEVLFLWPRTLVAVGNPRGLLTKKKQICTRALVQRTRCRQPWVSSRHFRRRLGFWTLRVCVLLSRDSVGLAQESVHSPSRRSVELTFRKVTDQEKFRPSSRLSSGLSAFPFAQVFSVHRDPAVKSCSERKNEPESDWWDNRPLSSPQTPSCRPHS